LILLILIKINRGKKYTFLEKNQLQTILH